MPKRKFYKKRNPKRKFSSTRISPSDWKLAKRVELKTGVHNFKEKIFDQITMTSDASGNYFLSTNFFFQDAPDYASYQRIFDAYQIVGVKIKYIISNPSSTSGEINPTPTPNTVLLQHATPSVCMVYSPTESITPTSMAQLLETKGARLQRLTTGVCAKYIKPKPLVKLYNGSIDTDYKIPNANKNTWISTNETDLQHYCLKEGWIGLNPNLTYAVQRVRTYYFKFKIPK